VFSYSFNKNVAKRVKVFDIFTVISYKQTSKNYV